MRHHVACRGPGRADARHTQRDAHEPVRNRALLDARAGDRPRHRLEAMRQPQCRQDAGTHEARQAANGPRERLRHCIRLRFTGRGRPDRAHIAHRRPRGCRLDSRRRQGQSDRSYAVARQGCPNARRRNRGGCEGDRRAHRAGPRDRRHVEMRRRRRRDGLRDARQLHRTVGEGIRTAGRSECSTAFGRALLHRHQGDPRRDARDCRSFAIPTDSSTTRRKSAAW